MRMMYDTNLRDVCGVLLDGVYHVVLEDDLVRVEGVVGERRPGKLRYSDKHSTAAEHGHGECHEHE